MSRINGGNSAQMSSAAITGQTTRPQPRCGRSRDVEGCDPEGCDPDRESPEELVYIRIMKGFGDPSRNFSKLTGLLKE